MQESSLLIIKPSPETVRHFPDRAAQWLLEDPDLFRQFIELVEPELAKVLDFSRAKRINRKFVLKDFSEIEHDITYRIPLVDPVTGAERNIFIYTLVEHQAEPDDDMPLRLSFYINEIYLDQLRQRDKREKRRRQVQAEAGIKRVKRDEVDKRWLYPVIPIVFFTGAYQWKPSLRLADMMPHLPKSLYRHIFDWDTIFFDLKSVNKERLLEFGSAMGYALRVWQEELGTIEELESRVMEAVSGVAGLSEEQREQWQRVTWFFVQLIYNRRTEEEYNSLYVKIREETRQSNPEREMEVREMVLTARQADEQRASVQIAREMLLDGLLAKYESLPSEIENSIKNAEIESLRIWMRRAMTSERLDEIFARN